MAVRSDDELLQVLGMVRDRGPIGERSLPDAVAHARRFTRLIPGDATSLIDLGSGGGLPGLVIAADRLDVSVTLIERRTTRADLIRRAVSALELANVQVVAADVLEWARRSPGFEVVTARSFGAPQVVAQAARAVGTAGGLLLVSEPPDDQGIDRWAGIEGVRALDTIEGIRRLELLGPR